MNFKYPRRYNKTLSTVLRHKVYIQSFTNVADNEGGFTKTWVDSENAYWASVEPLRAVQIAEFRSINVEATHLVKMRAATVIEEKQRIKFGEREFEVLTVENVQERNLVKWVHCKERRD